MDWRNVRISAWPPQPPEGLRVGAISQGVLIEHLASGTEIVVCKERHQHQNKRLALKGLDAILEGADGSGDSAFCLGDLVRKIKGSAWEGRVVGTYSTALTPEGYCVESSAHPGSVQIYPRAALERVG